MNDAEWHAIDFEVSAVKENMEENCEFEELSYYKCPAMYM